MQFAKYNYTPDIKNVNCVFSALTNCVRKKDENRDALLQKIQVLWKNLQKMRCKA